MGERRYSTGPKASVRNAEDVKRRLLLYETEEHITGRTPGPSEEGKAAPESSLGARSVDSSSKDTAVRTMDQQDGVRPPIIGASRGQKEPGEKAQGGDW